MPISEKKLKSVLEQGLQKYIDHNYPSPKGEDPKETAENIKNIVDSMVEYIDNELDKAGKYMRPGLKKATKNYIDKKFDQEV